MLVFFFFLEKDLSKNNYFIVLNVGFLGDKWYV